jgi:hypothetical protein
MVENNAGLGQTLRDFRQQHHAPRKPRSAMTTPTASRFVAAIDVINHTTIGGDAGAAFFRSEYNRLIDGRFINCNIGIIVERPLHQP